MTIQRLMIVATILAVALGPGVMGGSRDDFGDRLGMLPGLGARLGSLPPGEQQFLQHLIVYGTNIATSPETPPSILIKQLSVLECLLDDHFFNPRTPEADREILLEMLRILGGVQLDTALEIPAAEPVEPVEPEPGDCSVQIRVLENGVRFADTSDRTIVLMSLDEIAFLDARASEAGTFEWILGPPPNLAENFQVLVSADGASVSVTPSDRLRRSIQSFPRFQTGVPVTVKFTSASNPERQCEDQIGINLRYQNPRRQ